MATIRYTDRISDKVTELVENDARVAKRLFDYAVSVATANMQIDLIVGGRIVKTYSVEYVETIPSVRDMPRYA